MVPLLGRGPQPRAGEGTLTATRIICSPDHDYRPRLSLQGMFHGDRGSSILSDYPEPLLKCVQAILRGHEGKPLADLSDLEVGGIP